MIFRGILLGMVLIAFLISSATAQNQQKTSAAIGTPSSKTESHQLPIPPKSCATFNYTNQFPGFNYTAALGLEKLPAGCNEGFIRVLKQYTAGSCPETRANNYKVPALKIVNTCQDNILVADTNTCANAFAKAPLSAFADKGIGAGSIVDTGEVCWNAPQVFYFVENGCSAPITATIKLTSNLYTGECKNQSDSDDGGDDAGGVGSKKSSGLSSGAKAGIAIGVIAAVILIAVAVWFFCCQLRKG